MFDTKVTICGKHVEVKQYQYPPLGRQYNTNGGRKTKCNSIPYSEVPEDELRKRYRATSKKLRQLLECNSKENYMFLTLTFADTEDFDITSVDDCLEEFYKFKKRLEPKLKRIQKEFKYIGVIEFQDEQRNGAVHFHLVCNYLNIPSKELASIWGLGIVDKKYIQAAAITNKKIVHYLEKGIRDPRLQNKKKFLRSQRLEQPIICRNLDYDTVQEALKKDQAEYLDGYTLEKSAWGVMNSEEYYAPMPKEVLKLENF